MSPSDPDTMRCESCGGWTRLDDMLDGDRCERCRLAEAAIELAAEVRCSPVELVERMGRALADYQMLERVERGSRTQMEDVIRQDRGEPRQLTEAERGDLDEFRRPGRFPEFGRRPRRRRGQGTPVEVETFEQRDARLSTPSPGRPPTANPRAMTTPWLQAKVSTRLDKAVNNPVHIAGAGTECPICRRAFRGGRYDRLTCSAHCRDLARRVRAGDPTVEAAIKMMFEPRRLRRLR